MKSNHNYSNRFRILKGGKISLVVSALLGSVSLSFAAPSGGVVTSGVANISQSGNTTNINQSTHKASINWNKFNIASHETVNFNQPNVNSITLNRVIGNERSIIDGALNANGQVWILNSNGVLFGKNASINTSGLLATTKNISDTNFQKGNYSFTGDSTESVINQGTIKVKNNGYVIFASNEARNSGTIEVVKGRVQLTSANEYTINLNGNSLIDLSVDKGTLDALVENSGTILADGGEVYLTTHAVDELLRGVVNNTGIIEANSLDGISGHVELYAHGGTANIAGTIKAKGGFVETSGKELSVASSTKVEASKWLLDPTNMIIESTGGSDITGASVSATAIESNLASTDIELLADNDITVNEDITWGEATKLTLTAGDEIYVNATIENTNATNGGVYFNAANNSSKVIFNTNGKVIINNVHQLQWMNTALNGNYELGSNIDASITSTWNSNGSGGFYGFDPIGDSSNIFRGNLDGKGYTIDGLYINRASELYLGLIGYTHGFDKLISNIGLTNINFIGNDNVGGLVGYAFPISIEDSYVTGTINGNRNIGGLIGYANGPITITDSYASVNLTGNNGVGGLLGYKDSTSNLSISDSYTTGSINGNSSVGGLLGYGVGSVSTISNSYSTATVFGSGDYIGGLVGKIASSSSSVYISNSYASGDVTGNDIIGGLVGSAYQGQINNSYSAGNITGNNGVGGLVGYIYGTTINNSYFSGDITGNDRVGGLVGYYDGYKTISNSYASGAITGVSRVGGVVGILGFNASISNSYWDRDSTGQTLGVGDGDTIGATGIYSSTNTINAFNEATYAGFDFTNDWIIYEGHTRPLLRAFMTELTVKANDATRTYDGTVYNGGGTGVTYSNPTYDNSLVNGTLAYSGTDLKNAGTATINIDGLYSSQHGYIISYDTGTLTTNKKNITTNFSASDKVYDGTTNANVNGTLSGVISGDNITLDSFLASFTNKNVGNNKTVNITGISLGGTDIANYSFDTSDTSTTANISPKTLTANFLVNDKVYDGSTSANASLNGGLSGIISGDNVSLNSFSASFNDKNVGDNKTISISNISLGGTSSSNYTIASSSSSTASITPKNISATFSADNKVYDGTVDATVSGTLSDVILGDDITISQTASFTDKDAGENKTVSITDISLGGTDIANYSFDNSDTTTTASINKALATVTVDNKEVVYDGNTHTIDNYTVTGLVNNEDKSVLDSISISGSGRNAGTYTILALGEDDNYNLEFIDGSLTITPKSIVATFTANDKEYDGSTTAIANGSLSGVIQGDDIKAIYSSANFEDEKPANDKNVYIEGISLTGTDSQNYTLREDSFIATANINNSLGSLIASIINGSNINSIEDFNNIDFNSLDINSEEITNIQNIITDLLQQGETSFPIIKGIVLRILDGGINMPYGTKRELILDDEDEEDKKKGKNNTI